MKSRLLAGILLCLSVNILAIRQVGACESQIPDTLQVIYKTESLVIRKISNHVYQHTTFLNTNTFGRVSCNGMIVVNNNEAVVFDTPSSNRDSEELLNQMITKMHWKIKAIIATHFHGDCLGGLEAFHEKEIPSYANQKTIQFAAEVKATLPQHSFNKELVLTVGNKKIYAAYFGEGHTRDNIIGYFPGDNILFGGCLVKEINATKGNLADANTDAWSGTVKKIKSKYPQAKIVIPGHGALGGTELLDYTINLFAK